MADHPPADTSAEPAPRSSPGATRRTTNPRDPVSIVREFVHHPQVSVRRNALTALAALEDPDSLDELAERSRADVSVEVRRHGIEELLTLAETAPDLVRDVMATLAREDREKDLRIRAFSALTTLGDDKALATLAERTRLDPDPDVRRHGIEELLTLLDTQKELARGAIAAIAREDREKDLRIRALSALATVGDSESLEALAERARRDESPEIRRHAIDRLLGIEGDERTRCREAVSRVASRDENEATRVHALTALFESLADDPTTAATARAQALEDPVPAVRLEAIARLAQVGETGPPTLAEVAVRDPEPELRAAAARGLADLDTEALRLAATTLCKLLDETAATPQPSAVDRDGLHPLEQEDPDSQAQGTHDVSVAAYALLGRLGHAGKAVPEPAGSWWQRLRRAKAVPNLPDPETPRPWPWAAWRTALQWVVPTFWALAAWVHWAPGSAPRPPWTSYLLALLGIVLVLCVAIGRPVPLNYHYDRRAASLLRLGATTLRAALVTAGLLLLTLLWLFEKPSNLLERGSLTTVLLGTLAAGLATASALLGAAQAGSAWGASRWRGWAQILVGTAAAGLALVAGHRLVELLRDDVPRALDALGLSILLVFLPLGLGIASMAAPTSGSPGRWGGDSLRGRSFGLLTSLLVAAVFFLFAGTVLRTGWWWTPPQAIEGEALELRIPIEQESSTQSFEASFLQKVRFRIDQADGVRIRSRVERSSGEIVQIGPSTEGFWLAPGSFEIFLAEGDYPSWNSPSGSENQRNELRPWAQEVFNVLWADNGTLGDLRLDLNVDRAPLALVDQDPALAKTGPKLEGPGIFYWRADDDLIRRRFHVPYPQRIELQVLEAVEPSLLIEDDSFLYLEVRADGAESPSISDHRVFESGPSLTGTLAAGDYRFCLARVARSAATSAGSESESGKPDSVVATAVDRCRLDPGREEKPRRADPLHIELSTQGIEVELIESPSELRAASEDKQLSGTWKLDQVPVRWPLNLDTDQSFSIHVTQEDGEDLVVAVLRDGETVVRADDPCQIANAWLRQGNYEIEIRPYLGVLSDDQEPGPTPSSQTVEVTLEVFDDPTPGVLEGAAPGERQVESWEISHVPVEWELSFENPQRIEIDSTQESRDLVVVVLQDDVQIARGDDPSNIEETLPAGRYRVRIYAYYSDDETSLSPLSLPETVTVTLAGLPAPSEDG